MATAPNTDFERTRILLLCFAISQTASQFCQHLTVLALRSHEPTAAMLLRLEPDKSLRVLGRHGQSHSKTMNQPEQVLRSAIEVSRVLKVDLPDDSMSFVAIPFAGLGALGLTFGRPLAQLELAEPEFEMLQLLSELIALNSLPRMRVNGLLPKVYPEDAGVLWEFSPRQLRVLDEMAIGRTNAQIAKSLNVSESTVKQDSVKLFKILGVSSRQRAVAIGKDMGLI